MAYQRQLRGMELLYCLYDMCCPLNISMILGIEGRVSSVMVREALDSIQALHWQLRAVIDPDKCFAVRLTDSYRKIPLKILPLDETEISQCLEQELEERFTIEDAPLARCLFLWDRSNGSRLILTLHHSLFDGFSARQLAFEVAALLGAPESGSTHTSNQVSTSIEDCAEAYFPEKCKGVLATGRGLRRIVAQGLRRTFQHRAGEVGAITEVDNAGWRPGVLLTELDEKCVSRVRNTARMLGTTVHGALCAAQLLSAGQSVGLRFPHALATSTAVDLRPYLLPEVRERIGALFSAVITEHRITSSSTLWPLAVEIKSAIATALAREEHIRALPLVDAALRLLLMLNGRAKQSCNWLMKLSELAVAPHLMVSNIGPVPQMADVPGVRVVAASFVVGGPPDWHFGSTATTFGGRLYWNFVYNKAAIESKLAEEIAKRSITLLSSDQASFSQR